MWMLVALLGAPPAAALDVRLGVDHLSQIADGETATAFELGRAELGTRVRWGTIDSEARFETVRSAQPQSLFGIDRNSLVVRARRIWVGSAIDAGPVRLGARAGLIADPFLDAVEDGQDLRDLHPLSAQTSGLMEQSDLGARFNVSGFDQRLRLEVGLTNGEGATETERNDGVDTTVVLHGIPWRGDLFGGQSWVQLTALWRDGSRGAGAVQNDRLGAGLAARSPLGSVGATWVQAQGFAEQADRDAQDVELWANATVIDDWFGVLGRWTRTDLDTRVDAQRDAIMAGVYFDPRLPGRNADRRVRLYVTWSRITHGPDGGADPFAVDRDVIFARLTLIRDLNLGDAL